MRLRVVAVALLVVLAFPPEGAEETPRADGERGGGDGNEQCDGDACAGIKKEESYYFEGYADISIHEQMISDSTRTDTYRNTILDNRKLLRDAVVADIGAGTGILSMFCVQAGAKKVYAIEASGLAEVTRKIVAANGMEDKIEVIRSKVEIAEIPEKLDVIVSEWMGYSLLFENMLPSVLFARDKWLKKGGAILPDKAELFLAPVKDDGYYRKRLKFWDSVQDQYGVNMTAMREVARESLTRRPLETTVEPAHVLAGAASVQRFDLNTVTEQDLEVVKNDFSFQLFTKHKVYGFAIWFDVEFPGYFTLSTSPFQTPTHWYQTVLYIDAPFHASMGSVLSGSIVLKPHWKNKRFLDIELEYKVEGKDPVKKLYLLDA